MFKRGRNGAGIVACVLGVLLLGSSLLSTAPALHESAHDDSHTQSHFCIVTLLQSGQVLLTHDAVTAPALPIAFSFFSPLRTDQFPDNSEVRVHPTRGPPSA